MNNEQLILKELSDLNRVMGGAVADIKRNGAETSKLFETVNKLATNGCATGARHTDDISKHETRINSLEKLDRVSHGKAAVIGGVAKALTMWKASGVE